MWQETTVQDAREFLTTVVAVATSQHVSAIVVNAGGTGYVVGDILTITHAGAAEDLTIEVTAVSGGIITAAIIRSGGAFSNRVATVAVNAGGTLYVAGDILEIQGGTATAMGKAKVTTVSSGVITGVVLFETGGAYTVAPGLTAATTLGIGPSTFGGDDAATLDLTMTGLIGTTGIAATGGTGSGATFDLTLTATGWSTGSINSLQDTNDFSVNSVNDEKEVALMGTVTGGDKPFVLARTYNFTVGPDTARGVNWSMSIAFNPSLSFASQPGVISPVTPVIGNVRATPLFSATTQKLWLSISTREIHGTVRTPGASITAYQTFYVGLMNALATQTENPYPAIVAGSIGVGSILPDDGTDDVSGLTEAYIGPTTGGSAPIAIRRQEDASIVGVFNANNGVRNQVVTMYPVGETKNLTDSADASTITAKGLFGWFGGITQFDGSAATILMPPTPDTGGDLFLLVPATVLETNSSAEPVSAADQIRGELNNVFWISGTDDLGNAITAEDTLSIGDRRFVIFPNGHRSKRYSFMAFEEL